MLNLFKENPRVHIKYEGGTKTIKITHVFEETNRTFVNDKDNY